MIFHLAVATEHPLPFISASGLWGEKYFKEYECKMLHHVSLALQLSAGVTSQEVGKGLKNVNWMGSFGEEYLQQAGGSSH